MYIMLTYACYFFIDFIYTCTFWFFLRREKEQHCLRAIDIAQF